ncbi:MAG: effector-associated domain EAD1-containing protein [Chloroflexota bacterium]|nr:effector-associated domain EAD1-containing protein [Chloroflexota bacterium]
MKVDIQFLEELYEAIRGALEDRVELKHMVGLRLAENLDRITLDLDFPAACRALVMWAERQGRVEELVRAASAHKPHDAALRGLAEKVRQPASSEATDIQQPPVGGGTRPGGSDQIAGSYDFGEIRKLIIAALGDEELLDLSHDKFMEVYEQFTAGQSKGDRARMLLDYARRNNRVEELLARIQEANPNKYAEFEPKLQTTGREVITITRTLSTRTSQMLEQSRPESVEAARESQGLGESQGPEVKSRVGNRGVQVEKQQAGTGANTLADSPKSGRQQQLGADSIAKSAAKYIGKTVFKFG